MIKVHFTFILLFTLIILQKGSQAQEAFTGSGGEAIGADGTVSYSIGQIAYTDITSTTGNVIQGVQQPYEIVLVGENAMPGSQPNCSVFPNPAVDGIRLKFGDQHWENLKYHLYNMNGELLKNADINHAETNIPLNEMAEAIYIITLIDNNEVINTFKIIKTNSL